MIKQSLGAPARALAGPWTEKIIAFEKEQVDYATLKDYISGEANQSFIYDGDVNNSYGWAGQVTGLIDDVPTVAELFERMVKEATGILRNWGSN